MYALLLLAVVLLVLVLKVREGFVVKYGNPFNEEDIVSFDATAKGTRLFAITPDTCPADKADYDAGLCYPDCEVGYNGVGPVCWAETMNRGIGKVMKLQSCAASGFVGWTDTGLLCNEPIQCGKGWEFFTKGCWGGRVRPKKLKCDYTEHTDEVASLCYKKCPADKPKHVPGMPYLCFKGTRGLSYGRGVGTPPPIFAFGE
jgi:hypothetical protein